MTRTPMELTDPTERTRSVTPVELLTDVLSRVRLVGSVFLRAEYTAPWAYESPPADDLIRLLQPRAQRLILFHLIVEGSFWIRLSGGQHLEARAGEVVVLPYGAEHVMGSSMDVPPVSISSLLPPSPWQTLPVIRYGGGGERATVVCGYLHCDDPIFDPVVCALPPLFTVRPPAGPASNWMAASIQYALDASGGSSSWSTNVTVRLTELLFQEVLRLYVESGPPELGGWLAALQDPVVGRALVELHAEPSRKWTTEQLADRLAYSRSTLNERFVRLLGRAPMTYLGQLRLHLAVSLLRSTTLGVSAVANRIGYESEEAFNRAFKRAMGKPPAQWRQYAANELGVLSRLGSQT